MMGIEAVFGELGVVHKGVFCIGQAHEVGAQLVLFPATRRRGGVSNVFTPGKSLAPVIRLKLIPVIPINACLFKKAFGERPINVSFVRIGDDEFLPGFPHDKMFAAAFGRTPAQSAESPNEFTPLDWARHIP